MLEGEWNSSKCLSIDYYYYNIKVALREIGCEDVNWLRLDGDEP
jgi:hypothetical protein